MKQGKNRSEGRVSRRGFIVRAGLGTIGVLAVGAYVFRNPIRRKLLDYIENANPPYMGNTSNPMIWFELTIENLMILHSPKVEMGQGTFTGMGQLAAEELDIGMDQLRVVHASTASGNIDGFGTGGSTSIASLWKPVRELAATMRELIKNEAAKKLNLPVSALQTRNGIVYGEGVELTYAQVMEGAEDWDLPSTPVLKSPSEFNIIGKPVPRVDLSDKVFGKTIFGIDAELPDMLYGAVVRPDKIGAKFISAEVSKAANMPGVVKIVQESDFVGVVARSWIEAQNAKKTIKVKWDVQKNYNTQDILDLISVGEGEKYVIQTHGKARSTLQDTGIIKSEFRSPLGAHAQLEPNGALAHVEAEKATIYVSTQVANLTLKDVAKRLGMDIAQVNIVPTFVGGGFGRKLHTPHTVHAAVMSKAVGKPVKYIFSREEEFQHDMFRPPSHHILRAKLNDKGDIEALEHQFASGDVAYHSAIVPGILNSLIGADMGAIRGGFIQYSTIPNLRSVYWHKTLPFATSWWRGLGLLANTFAIESFIDELANRAGKNAVEFRLDYIGNENLSDRRLRNVIQVARDKSGYNELVKDGIAMGFAASVDAGTPCAQVAQVSIENNEIRVTKILCVLDPGFVVNPDQVRAQCEGNIIMGLSASLYEEMFVEDSQLHPSMYGPYKMALMKNAPKEIEIELIQGKDQPGSVGEPPIGPTGAAIANAIFRLTGQRPRQMPLRLG